MSIGVHVETLPDRIVFYVHCRRLRHVLRLQEVQRRINRGTQARIVGRNVRGEAVDDLAVATDQEFFEVPHHARRGVGGDAVTGKFLAHRALAGGVRMGAGQCPIQRVRLVASDGDLGKHREGDVVGELAELRDLRFAARLLAVEVVGRKRQHFQALCALVAIQRFQPFVLRGQAALGGDVDHQQHLAAIVRQGGGLAIDAGHGNVV